MKRRLLLGFTVLALVFCALPTLAASAAPEGDALLAAIFAPAPAPDPGVAPPPQDAAKRPGIRPKSSCVANCWDGSTVPCSGNTCTATNSSCPGTRGSCTADGVTTYCPACRTICNATATCSPSGSVSCSGTSGDCFSVNKCYAYCDGVYHFCPSHGICPL
jgi:hypothetical protein